MAPRCRIKRDDVVVVISGRDAVGKKTGKVLQVLRERGRAVVQGVNMIKKHMRKSQDAPKGAIVDREAPIVLSNLQLYCPRCKKGVKVARRQVEDRRVRQCKLCGHAFD